jgi:hypothetical protein
MSEQATYDYPPDAIVFAKYADESKCFARVTAACFAMLDKQYEGTAAQLHDLVREAFRAGFDAAKAEVVL